MFDDLVLNLGEKLDMGLMRYERSAFTTAISVYLTNGKGAYVAAVYSGTSDEWRIPALKPRVEHDMAKLKRKRDEDAKAQLKLVVEYTQAALKEMEQ